MSTVYENEIEQLIKFQNNKFPNSLVFSGNEVEIIRKIATTFAYVMVNNSKIDSKYNFEQLLNDDSRKNSPYILHLEKIYLEDKKRFKNKVYRDDINLVHTFFNTKDENNQKRVCIINAIDDFSIDAINSLLKIIEEPRKNSHFFIINKNKSKLLNTIKSRSHIINFRKVDRNTYYYYFNPNNEQNKLLFELTNGSIYLSNKIINYKLTNIFDHFIKLLSDNKSIKANTANHYIKFVNDNIINKNDDNDLSIFFEYLILIVNYHIKHLSRQKQDIYVRRLINIDKLIDYYKKQYLYFNTEFESTVSSLFYKMRNV